VNLSFTIVLGIFLLGGTSIAISFIVYWAVLDAMSGHVQERMAKDRLCKVIDSFHFYGIRHLSCNDDTNYVGQDEIKLASQFKHNSDQGYVIRETPAGNTPAPTIGKMPGEMEGMKRPRMPHRPGLESHLAAS
jgi:hypothetical protein